MQFIGWVMPKGMQKKAPESISQWRLLIKKRLRSLDQVKISGLLHPPGYGLHYFIFQMILQSAEILILH
jgi:hypothetical protein